MFVDKSMTKKVITVFRDTGILEAGELMKTNSIRHLPVVDADGRLVGIVTDRDIRSATPSTILGSCTPDEKDNFLKLTVKDIMTADPITLSPMYTLQDALLLIQKHRVGAFPVVDSDGILKGILSIRDLTRAFINVLGIGEPGTLVGILVEEKFGQMKKIVDAITEERISTGSILVARHWDKDKRAVFPYLLTNNVARIKKKFVALGFTLIDPMDWYLDQLPKNE